jgi:glutathione synthase/RimK-type ligase-like ATP-grasp enzyme
MARVLIASYPDDVHAFEVALALRNLGHEAQIWHGADFPTRQRASIRFDGNDVRWSVQGPELDIGDRRFDTVWHRRPTPPALPQDLHPGDLPVARRECEDFIDGLWHLVEPDALWVNPLASRRRSNLKAVQLLEATRAGFSIPPTLVSNDPTAIRAFLQTNEPAIYKAFYPAQWEHGEDVAVLMTSELSAADLPEDDVLRLTPGIFQHRVPKAHELRVNYLGGSLIIARLLSQQVEVTRLDWRASAAALAVEPDELSADGERACHELMRRLGLVFGCIDLIVTPDDELVFLEVNPMGQFLWVEDCCPELPLLDAFTAFLAAGRNQFQYAPSKNPLRHHDYYDRAMARLEAAKQIHIDTVESFVSRDEPASLKSEHDGLRDAEALG